MIKPNYLDKLLRLESKCKLPAGLWHAHIRHDDWCGIFRGERCDCDPDIRIVEDVSQHRADRNGDELGEAQPPADESRGAKR